VKDNQHLFDAKTISIPLITVILMWLVFWIEMRWHTDFASYGIQPRTWSGMLGVFASPFIHGGFSHLWSNTLPMLLLGTSLFYFYRSIGLRVFLLGLVGSGVITWLIARDSYHIGASGVIYMLASFLFFKGIITRYYRLIALSLIIVFLYGSLVWYLFPIDPSISWEGHLGGALTGFILAMTIRVKIQKEQTFAWQSPDYNEEEDLFMQQFDEDGNFAPIEPIALEEEE
jgi:membrane associated rhomboid family serine protease